MQISVVDGSNDAMRSLLTALDILLIKQQPTQQYLLSDDVERFFVEIGDESEEM